MTAEVRPPLRVVRPGEVPVTPAADARLSSRAAAAPHLSDEVVEAAKRGDGSAWEAAYAAYAKGLMGFLVLRLGDREDAAEALSETFLRALTHARSLRNDGAPAFRAWLYKIARNVATDRLRYRQRLKPQADTVEVADIGLAGLDERLIASEEAAQVRDAFAELEVDDREVLWLRVCAGLSSDDVGRIVGKRPGAVRMQQQRALTALSRRMDR